LWLHVRARRRGCGGDWKAVVLAVGALLSYEAAIVLPVVLLAVELLFFREGRPAASIRGATLATSPYWAAAGAYVLLWHVLFSDGVRGYDLAATASGVLDNYGRLLYSLFYGHRRLAYGAAYVLLFALCARLLARQRRTAALACVMIAAGYLPFAPINGFAHRFAYFSGMGFALLVSLCVISAIRSTGRWRRLSVAAAALVICVFYSLEVRKILREWRAAGELAARIPETVRKLHPQPEEGSVLVFRNVPRMYGRAMVYPTGLEEAIQRQYPVKVHVRENGAATKVLSRENRNRVRVYKYVGGEDVLIEMKLD
jgi:hypothetical protein